MLKQIVRDPVKRGNVLGFLAGFGVCFLVRASLKRLLRHSSSKRRPRMFSDPVVGKPPPE